MTDSTATASPERTTLPADLRTYIALIVGDELLEGKRVDRHAAYITRTLGEHGLGCQRVEILRDNRSALANAASKALSESSLVIVTGGLGPTVDDITREALSDATGIALRENADALAMIEARFRAFNRPMSSNNRAQAMVPERGGFFFNDHGTAPGLYFESDSGLLLALPGPPRELEPMFADRVLPFLRERNRLMQRRRYARALHFAGIGESNIDQIAREELAEQEDIGVSLLARLGLVDLTLIQLNDEPASARRLDDAFERIRQRMSDFIYAEDDASLEAVVGRALTERGQTLAVAESCTGGLLGAMLTEVAGASEFFLGGVIAYHNRVKENALGVQRETLAEGGAVSLSVAEEMALGAARVLGADWGVAITGVAGPSGGTEEKPAGTVCVAVAQTGKPARAIRVNFAGNRAAIRQRAAIQALDHLRRCILGLSPLG